MAMPSALVTSAVLGVVSIDHPITRRGQGQAQWVVPLAWAHAWFLAVSHELARFDVNEELHSRGSQVQTGSKNSK